MAAEADQAKAKGEAMTGKAKPRTVKAWAVLCGDGAIWRHEIQYTPTAADQERRNGNVACWKRHRGPHAVVPLTGTFTPQPARAKARKGERSR